MKTKTSFLLSLILLAGFASAETPTEPKHLTFRSVPFTDVHFDDHFWSPRLKTNREISIPHNYDWCEKTGRFTNFAKAAKLMDGKFEGIYYNDSDVYKVLEGTAYSLAQHPDPELEKRADAVIASIAAAQQPNGYIYAFYTLNEPHKRWTEMHKHELYCAGHLIEGAVAYKQATGKDTLLNVAEKCADHIVDIFVTNKTAKFDVPGHEEIELALVKLYQQTGKEKYLKLAEHFLDIRGDKSKRTDKLAGANVQDHLPVREQKEIVGHAVRAMYLYAGVADIAAYTGDKGYLNAMDSLWGSVVNRKMYITGGVGASHAGESFGKDYELPNKTAYCETCAAVGLVFWAHRMNLLTGDAKYADVVERAMYNGVLAGIGLDGKSFFYVNPLEADAEQTNRHDVVKNTKQRRQPFFSTACCPTNVVRFIPSLPGYQYAVDDDGIVVNQFIQGNAVIKTSGADISIKTVGGYPWSGQMKFSGTVKRHNPNDKKPITIKLRVPDWCHYPAEEPAIELYEGERGNEDSYSKRKADQLKKFPYKIEKGYVVTTIRTEPDFEFTYHIPFTYRRIAANPRVVADQGRVAIQRGPLVYCFEEADNPDLNDRTALKKDMHWHEDLTASSGGGLAEELKLSQPVTIRVKTNTGKTLTAIPYFAWDSRNKLGKMMVWLRQEGLPKNLDPDLPVWKTESGEPRLYQPLPDDKSPYYPRDPRNKPKNCLLRDVSELESEPEISASFCFPNDSAAAVIDGIEPKNSIDHSIPRLTFWDHKGTAEWLELDFGKARKVSQSAVYWFDDTGRGECKIPQSWTLSYKDGGDWKPVTVKTPGTFGIEKDKYNAVEFDAVETRALRLDVRLQDGSSGGVLEWKTK
ncbi:MAG: glycoside hydrolase family 127 protein [Planctomycetaceae bacterium]|nr:glycoside hydrolase family 127 protein [Planctomycetaceae bacterium]